MNMQKKFICTSLALCCLGSVTWAEEVEIPVTPPLQMTVFSRTGGGGDFPLPNVFIIIDNSGSMRASIGGGYTRWTAVQKFLPEALESLVKENGDGKPKARVNISFINNDTYDGDVQQWSSNPVSGAVQLIPQVWTRQLQNDFDIAINKKGFGGYTPIVPAYMRALYSVMEDGEGRMLNWFNGKQLFRNPLDISRQDPMTLEVPNSKDAGVAATCRANYAIIVADGGYNAEMRYAGHATGGNGLSWELPFIDREWWGGMRATSANPIERKRGSGVIWNSKAANWTEEHKKEIADAEHAWLGDWGGSRTAASLPDGKLPDGTAFFNASENQPWMIPFISNGAVTYSSGQDQSNMMPQDWHLMRNRPSLSDYAFFAWGSNLRPDLLKPEDLQGDVKPNQPVRVSVRYINEKEPDGKPIPRKSFRKQLEIPPYWDRLNDPATWPHLRTYVMGFSDGIPRWKALNEFWRYLDYKGKYLNKPIKGSDPFLLAMEEGATHYVDWNDQSSQWKPTIDVAVTEPRCLLKVCDRVDANNVCTYWKNPTLLSRERIKEMTPAEIDRNYPKPKDGSCEHLKTTAGMRLWDQETETTECPDFQKFAKPHWDSYWRNRQPRTPKNGDRDWDIWQCRNNFTERNYYDKNSSMTPGKGCKTKVDYQWDGTYLWRNLDYSYRIPKFHNVRDPAKGITATGCSLANPWIESSKRFGGQIEFKIPVEFELADTPIAYKSVPNPAPKDALVVKAEYLTERFLRSLSTDDVRLAPPYKDAFDNPINPFHAPIDGKIQMQANSYVLPLYLAGSNYMNKYYDPYRGLQRMLDASNIYFRRILFNYFLALNFEAGMQPFSDMIEEDFMRAGVVGRGGVMDITNPDDLAANFKQIFDDIKEDYQTAAFGGKQEQKSQSRGSISQTMSNAAYSFNAVSDFNEGANYGDITGSAVCNKLQKMQNKNAFQKPCDSEEPNKNFNKVLRDLIGEDTDGRQSFADNRPIITFYKGTDSNGSLVEESAPFFYSKLDSDAQKMLSSDPVRAEALVNYMRGSSLNEKDANATAGKDFRKRDNDKMLGTISYNSPISIRKIATLSNRHVLSKAGSDGTSKYAEFIKNKQENHDDMVAFGSNDGHLYILRSDAKKDLNAFLSPIIEYVPRSILSKAEPFALSDNAVNMVAGQITVSDAQVGEEWKTILVGTLGAGGKAVYALNLSLLKSNVNPKNELKKDGNLSSLKNFVMWEKNVEDADTRVLGNVMGKPQIVWLKDKSIMNSTNKGGDTNGVWVVLIPCGYNAHENGDSTTPSIAAIVGLDLKTGKQLFTLQPKDTMQGESKDNAIIYLNTFDKDGDGGVEYVYAGDLQGNVWKFALDYQGTHRTDGTPIINSSIVYNNPIVKAIAYDENDKEVAQPITTEIAISSYAPYNRGVLLVFGTGKHLNENDVTRDGANVTDEQAIYGIWDNEHYMMPLASNSKLPLKRSTRGDNGMLYDRELTDCGGLRLKDAAGGDNVQARCIAGDKNFNWRYARTSGEATGYLGWVLPLVVNKENLGERVVNNPILSLPSIGIRTRTLQQASSGSSNVSPTPAPNNGDVSRDPCQQNYTETEVKTNYQSGFYFLNPFTGEESSETWTTVGRGVGENIIDPSQKTDPNHPNNLPPIPGGFVEPLSSPEDSKAFEELINPNQVDVTVGPVKVTRINYNDTWIQLTE